MRLLVDMNLTPRWVRSLADAGHEPTHWSAVGDPTASDEQICSFAREQGYVVLTNDLDFPQILAHTSAVRTKFGPAAR
jgi:predicted nuclease of predicted toxin-antitoxin system